MEPISIDIEKLSQAIESDISQISFAFLFGSSRDGKVSPGSDLDVAVYFRPGTITDADLIEEVTGAIENAGDDAECDLTILNTAGPMVRFEALKGRLLFVRDEAMDDYAGFYSLTCREYEEAVWWMNTQLRYRGYAV